MLCVGMNLALGDRCIFSLNEHQIGIVCITQILRITISILGQAGAQCERTKANGGDAIRDGHAGQAGAPTERIIVNGGDAIRDGHAGQTGAVIERILANDGDAIRDGVTTGNNLGSFNECSFIFVKQH